MVEDELDGSTSKLLFLINGSNMLKMKLRTVA